MESRSGVRKEKILGSSSGVMKERRHREKEWSKSEKDTWEAGAE